MELIEKSRVIHAGTMNSSNATVAAALATIQILEKENPYNRFFKLGQQLMEGLKQAASATNQSLLVQGPGPMFNVAFTQLDKITDYRDTLTFDKVKLSKFISGMHDNGVRIIGRGLWYISAAHTEKDVQFAIEKAEKVFKKI
jgi:glutamate-1-semialdehyde 2,1-aminomutase